MIRRLLLGAVLATSLITGSVHAALPAAGTDADWQYSDCFRGFPSASFSFTYAGRILHLGKTYAAISGSASGRQDCTGTGSYYYAQFTLNSVTSNGVVADYCVVGEPNVHYLGPVGPPDAATLGSSFKIVAECASDPFDPSHRFRLTMTFYGVPSSTPDQYEWRGVYTEVAPCGLVCTLRGDLG